MKALPVDKLPEGDWLYEIKFDGYRAPAFKDGKDVRLVSRNKKAFDYPQLLDALKKLPAQRAILDGEIAALDEKGRSSFTPPIIQKHRNRWKGKTSANNRSLPGANSLPLFPRNPLKASGFLTSSVGPKTISFVSPKSLASRGWSPNARIQFTKAAGAAVPGSSSRSPKARNSLSGLYIARRRAEIFRLPACRLPESGRAYVRRQSRDRFFGKAFSTPLRQVAETETAQLFVCKPAGKDQRQMGTWDHASGHATLPMGQTRLVAQVKFTEWTNDDQLRQPVFLGLRTDEAKDVVRE
jgi:bifunctional non-homologous end joining protein LigD